MSLLDRADGAKRHRDAEKVGEKVLRRAPAQVIDAREERNERHQPRTEG
jgi:hypothetical protein